MSQVYTAVVLNREDQESLLSHFSSMFFQHLLPVGFTSENNRRQRLAHHMTMNMGPCRQRTLLGSKIDLIVDAWACDEKVMAVRVSDHNGVYCNNETPHITIFVNPEKGGSPKHSNGLVAWIPLQKKLSVSGTVEELV